MVSAFDTIDGAIDPDRLTGLLTAAVEQYSPSYAEEPAMDVFAEAIGGAGLAYLHQPVAGAGQSEARGNLIVELGPRPASLMWVGHVDTVPPMEEEQLSPRVEDGLLYGLGSADMKGGCAAMVEALLALTASGVELKRGLAVALVVGEEEYGDGSAALIERTGAPLTVIGEPTGLVPCLDHYGYFEYRLRARGNQVHAALPELGASAIHAMLGWLTAAFEGAQAPALFDRLAMNPREIRGGGDMFVVAEACEAFVDIHGVPGVSEADVDALIADARERAALAHAGCALQSDCVFAAPGYAVPDDDDRLDPLRRAYRRRDGADAGWRPAAFRSHSDGSLFHQAGSLPVICGPGRLEVAHTRHEHVALAEVEAAARLYAAMIYEACVA